MSMMSGIGLVCECIFYAEKFSVTCQVLIDGLILVGELLAMEPVRR
ncbi:hypothetical protein GCM10008022_45010 [Paenibacillus hunanensis]|nr:hypothetical protein GCM10008022_45010 [Paenibacillus hunanensis]